MKKLFLFLAAFLTASGLWANTITYTATEQLALSNYNAPSTSDPGLHTNAFKDANGTELTITMHSFSNGIGTLTFNNDVDVATIGAYAFTGCSTMTSVTIPETVTSIGDYAFSSCSSLTSIVLPEGVTSIGFSAFYLCSGLTSITIPNSVTTIGGRAFEACNGLKVVRIKADQHAQINGLAFACSKLSTIIFGKCTPSISGELFSSGIQADIPITSISFGDSFSIMENNKKMSPFFLKNYIREVYLEGTSEDIALMNKSTSSTMPESNFYFRVTTNRGYGHYYVSSKDVVNVLKSKAAWGCIEKTISSGLPGRGGSKNYKPAFPYISYLKPIEWFPNKLISVTNEDDVIGRVKIDNSEVTVSETITTKTYDESYPRILHEMSDLTIDGKEGKTISLPLDEGYVPALNIPYIITANNQGTITLPTDVTAADTTDIVVRDGATFTIETDDITYNRVSIYPSGKLIVKGTGVKFRFLEMLGGIDEINGEEDKYGVPQLEIQGSGDLEVLSGQILYRMRVNNKQMYQVSFPYDVYTSDITRVDGVPVVMDQTVWAEVYDGALRAQGGAYDDETSTWKSMTPDSAVFHAGIGYSLAAPKKKGFTNPIIEFPMIVTDNLNATTKSVPVQAHEGPRALYGWNVIGNPFLSTLPEGATLSLNGIDYSDQVIYIMDEETGTKVQISGTFADLVDDSKVPPFKRFFIQIGEDGNLVFDKNGSDDTHSAPTRVQASTDAKFSLILKDDANSDKVYFKIDDQLTAEYDIPGDNVKLAGASDVPQFYTIYGGEKLAQVGVNADLVADPFQLGYIAPTAGTLTILLNESRKNTDNVSHIYLYDGENQAADLMVNDYTFTTEAGTNDTRFHVLIVMKDGTEQNSPTSTQSLLGVQPVTKVLRNQQVYILRNGVEYNILGQSCK